MVTGSDRRSVTLSSGNLNRAVNAQPGAPLGFEHPQHFLKRSRPIGKELKSLLTQHNVKTFCLEWQVKSTTLDPFDGSRPCPRDAQHCGVKVYADEPPGMPALFGQPRHDTSAAGDVEQAFAAPRRDAVEQIIGPNRSDSRHEIALVNLRRAGIYLPMFSG
jgi:hypothetical protein